MPVCGLCCVDHRKSIAWRSLAQVAALNRIVLEEQKKAAAANKAKAVEVGAVWGMEGLWGLWGRWENGDVRRSAGRQAGHWAGGGRRMHLACRALGAHCARGWRHEHAQEADAAWPSKQVRAGRRAFSRRPPARPRPLERFRPGPRLCPPCPAPAQHALEESDAAVAAGSKYLVTKVDVGLDAKALQVRGPSAGHWLLVWALAPCLSTG